MKSIFLFIIPYLMLVVLSACGQADNTVDNTATQNEEIVKIAAAESIESNATEEAEETIESSTSLEETIKDFQPLASTGTFEYDSINNCVILDGDTYHISTNEMDCYAGYMFYWLTNGTMEDIRDSINNNELENKYWRGSYTDELHAKVRESTMLEDFTEGGGRILNYYILNEQGFLSALELAQMPVVVEYSFDGETYHAIWVICTSRIAENEEVTYQITDIFYLEAMNGWGLEY